MNTDREALVAGFLTSAARYPETVALDTGGEQVTYRRLLSLAQSIGADLLSCRQRSPLCGVLSGPNVTAFSGMLGALLAGRGFVPLNPSHPIERLSAACARTNLQAMVVAEDACPILEKIWLACPQINVAIVPCADSGAHRTSDRLKLLVGADRAHQWTPECVAATRRGDVAYVMFTSGSTGDPKGVPVTNGNAIAYLRNAAAKVEPEPSDRFALSCDLTFDLSVHPIWLAWEYGASLYVVPERTRIAPASSIREKKISVWTSVPAVVTMMRRMQVLSPGTFPTIRHSMFCGEPLTTDQVAAWQAACPNTTIDNFYGPTEATVAITSLRCHRALRDQDAENGVIAIGHPFPDQQIAIVDTELNLVREGETGELLLSGTQVTTHYMADPDLTASKYVHIPALGSQLWYRTGDVVRRDRRGCVFFVGRADSQVKLFGFRVELQAVESAVRQASGAEVVACIAWPVANGSVQGLYCYVSGVDPDVSEGQIISHCQAKLPHYMIPRRVFIISALPLAPNGKIDRKQLQRMLEERRDSH